MKWIKIDTNNLPETEVLAANFNKGTFGYSEYLLGYINENEAKELYCENHGELLENVSHYIDPNDIEF